METERLSKCGARGHVASACSHPLLRTPATWIAIGLTLVASVYVVVALPFRFAVVLGGSLLLTVVIGLVVIPLTAGAQRAAWTRPVTDGTYSRARLWWQLGAVALAIVLLEVSLVVAGPLRGNGLFAVGILGFELLVPLGVVLLLGARPRDLAIARGHRSWLVAVVASAASVAIIVIMMGAGRVTLARVIAILFSSLLTAGLPEEVMWRGVLMTRLAGVMTVPAAVVVSSVVFGLGHFFNFYTNPGLPTSGQVVPTLAYIFANTVPAGILLAIIVQRTRSLTAAIISHTLSDAAAATLLPLLLG